MDYEAVSRRLRSWMTDKGWTLAEAAEHIGVPVSTLKGWLYGGRDMGFDGALKVCEVFGKPLDELACREKEAV